MQLKLVHTTGFEYAGKALASYNTARMTPLTGPGQIVVHTRLDVTPTPWLFDYRDYFGNAVTAFEVLDPHDSMTVTATSTVHTDRTPHPPPQLSWEQVRLSEVTDRWTEYLELPSLVAPHEEVTARARDVAAEAATPSDAALSLSRWVHDEVTYEAGSTDSTTSAADAWEQRAGVCQDLAHLVIGGLRSIGVPTRYVSGYLHPSKKPEVGATVAGESHAWVEWWDDGWRGYDPTNDSEPGDRWVVAATGRDYYDVRPLNGIFTGEGTSSMFVRVDVTRLD